MDESVTTATDQLREAIGSYHGYCEAVDHGLLLVNADDDPEDVVRAALVHVQRCIGDCRSLGLTEAEIYQITAGVPTA